MKVTALKPHSFAGKQRKTGDEYEISKQSDIELMVKIGHVKCENENALNDVLDPLKTAPANKQSARPKRTYNRRDMTAQ